MNKISCGTLTLMQESSKFLELHVGGLEGRKGWVVPGVGVQVPCLGKNHGGEVERQGEHILYQFLNYSRFGCQETSGGEGRKLQ